MQIVEKPEKQKLKHAKRTTSGGGRVREYLEKRTRIFNPFIYVYIQTFKVPK